MKYTAFLLLLLLSSTALKAGTILHRYALSGKAQGSDFSLVYYHSAPVIRQAAIDSILQVIDLSMSIYHPQSLISQFNRRETSELLLDNHFYQVVRAAQYYHRVSEGMFDISVAPLVQAWGFGPKRIKEPPTDAQIAAILPAVGMEKLLLQGKRLFKQHAAVQLDVNGIAQGYSVDVLADYIKAQGVSSFVVEIGGELRIQGHKPQGEKFTIAIERPAGGASSSGWQQELLYLQQGALTTAGNFQKQYLHAGQKVTHHINPQTGYTFVTPIVSATVYARTAMEADALDNYIMALSPEAAIKFANKRKNFEVYIVYQDSLGNFREMHSRGFEKLFKK